MGAAMMRNFPIGRFPLAESLWRAISCTTYVEERLVASYIGQVDREREAKGIPSIFDDGTGVYSARVSPARLLVGLFIALVACGDNRHAPAHLLDAFEAPPDVPFIYDAGLGCCVHYPDASAIAACAAPTFPACTCGVIACARPAEDGGGFLKIGTCGPSPDGGSCLPPDAATDAATDAAIGGSP